MADDPIRELLAGLPRANMGVPHGYVRVLAKHVPEGDRLAVEAWVEGHGGRREAAPSIKSRGRRPRQVVARETGPMPYYLIPRDALGL